MDYYFWVLRNDLEVILVDTGFSEQGGARRGRITVVPPLLALRELGIEPDDVRLVIVTHAHYDHIGNLCHFPNAQAVLSRREYTFWTGPGDKPIFMSVAETVEIEELRRRHELGTLRLVDDKHSLRPGVTLFDVGGHTPGQLVVLVETGQLRVVLASDALHYYEEAERDRPFAIASNVPEMYDAYAWLRELADDDRTVVVAGHDPDVMRRFPRQSGPVAGHAVLVAGECRLPPTTAGRGRPAGSPADERTSS